MHASWYSYFPVSLKDSIIEARKLLPQDIRRELLAELPVFDYQIAVDTSKSSIVDRVDSILGIGKSNKYFKYLNVEVDAMERSKYQMFQVRPKADDFQNLLLAEVEGTSCPDCGFCPDGFRSIQLMKKPKMPISYVTRVPSWNVYFVFSSDSVQKAMDWQLTGISFRQIDRDWFLASLDQGVWSESCSLQASFLCAEHSASITPLGIGETWQSVDFKWDFCILRGTRVGSRCAARVPPNWVVSERGFRFLSEGTHLELATVRLNELCRPWLLDTPNVVV
jgi:hypothetical protein